LHLVLKQHFQVFSTVLPYNRNERMKLDPNTTITPTSMGVRFGLLPEKKTQLPPT